MDTQANIIIDGLGGTTAVAKMISAPPSTVHSWRKIGIPASRLAHLKLAAQAEGKAWPTGSIAAEDDRPFPGPSGGSPTEAAAA